MRFATEKYSYDEGSISNLYAHLTNSSINKCARPPVPTAKARRKTLQTIRCTEPCKALCVFPTAAADGFAPRRARFSPSLCLHKEGVGTGCKWTLSRLRKCTPAHSRS